MPPRRAVVRPARYLLWGAAALAGLATAAALALTRSVWPGALLIRRTFDDGSRRTTAGLAPFLPPADAVVVQRDLTYADGSPDSRLDVYSPAELGPGETRPTIMWVHGGGWLAGRKENLESWARILASRGVTVVVPGYSLAPGARYPTQLQQVLQATAFLLATPPSHVDPHRLVLAGDSAGASLVAQAATAITTPGYADLAGVRTAVDPEALRGLVLCCGPYELEMLGGAGTPASDDARSRLLAAAGHAIGWSYLGSPHFLDDPRTASLVLVDHVAPGFPPAFVTGGNADPLTVGAHRYAERLAAVGNEVETLFFPDDYREMGVPLGHEYQFDLRLEAAELALERSLDFVRRHVT